MAEEQEAEATEEKKSSFVMTAVLLLAAMLVPAIIGLSAYTFWLKPRLAATTTPTATAANTDVPAFPETMQAVDFDEMYITVQTEDPDVASPLLIAQVSLSCADEATSAMVMGKKQYFAAEILSAHQGRTRAELNDPLVQNSILEQIKQRSNILLKRLAPKMDLKILKAMYIKFAIMDLG